MMRPNKDHYFLDIAWAVSRRATCYRRAVGCVLVNGLGHIVGSGYNGRPAGYEHCNEMKYGIWHKEGEFKPEMYPHACKDAFAPSGAKPRTCEAVHAEQNALLQCYDTLWIDTAYVTRAPCEPCTKLLLNTSCRRIVFSDVASVAEVSKELWLRNNSRQDRLPPHMRKERMWDHIPVDNPFLNV